MRVIAGTARRILLVAPAGQDTRPTADRAKEALFSILSDEIRGARFLDIFCGSGAVGIEALSRGAETAVFVENAPSAIEALKTNLKKTGLGSAATIMEMSASDAVNRLAGEKFDIIFLDPPYDSALLADTLPKARNLLAENGIIIAETDAKADAFKGTHETRTYGRAKFLFFRGGT